MTTQSAAAKLTCDQAFFFSGKGEKEKERIPFPLASKQKGKKDRLIAGYCKSEYSRDVLIFDNSTVRVIGSAEREKIKIKGTIFSFVTPTPIVLQLQ